MNSSGQTQAHQSDAARSADLSIFGGPFRPGSRCVIAFRAGEHAGSAVIDTGFPNAMVSEAFAAKLGAIIDDVPGLEIAGIGDNLTPGRVTNLKLTLSALSGKDVPVEGEVLVGTLPDAHDFLIGTSTLNLGVFVIDGPAGAWAWTIDHARLAGR